MAREEGLRVKVKVKLCLRFFNEWKWSFVKHVYLLQDARMLLLSCLNTRLLTKVIITLVITVLLCIECQWEMNESVQMKMKMLTQTNEMEQERDSATKTTISRGRNGQFQDRFDVILHFLHSMTRERRQRTQWRWETSQRDLLVMIRRLTRHCKLNNENMVQSNHIKNLSRKMLLH